MLHIHGLTIRITQDVPRFQLSKDCPVSDAYRADTNAWAVKWCGTTNVMEDGQILSASGTLYMNPRTEANLRAKSITFQEGQ